MGWNQFRYIFNSEVSNAMRYSIEEAIRKAGRSAPWTVTAQQVADDAVESFKRKMEKHTA